MTQEVEPHIMYRMYRELQELLGIIELNGRA